MRYHIVSAICLLGIASTAASSTVGEFHNLGPGNAVSGLSYDGSVAAGTSPSEYFIWTSSTGITGIGGQTAGGGVGGQAKISDDGMRICGTYLNPGSGQFEMSYYDAAGGMWIPLGGIGATCTTGAGPDETSSGWGISNDGMSVVGLGWFDFCGPAHAIQWDESSGMTMDLGSTVMDRSSRANATNMDGSVVVGWQDAVDGFRQAAVWDGGVQMLIATMGGDPVSEANDVDAAGDWVVGNASFATFDEAWRWSEATGVEMLGMICPGCFFPRGFATAVSNDGSVIVGFNRALGVPPTGGVGFIWTEATGMLPLNDYLVSQGVDTGGFNFSLPLAISGDGLTIGGLGVPAGVPFGGDGFVVRLPSVSEAIPLSLHIKQGACPAPVNPGSNGVTQMVVTGEMDVDLSMVDASSITLGRCDGVGGFVAPNDGPPGPAGVTIADLNHPNPDPATCATGGCTCNDDQSSDGIDDLKLKFNTAEMAAVLGLGSEPVGAIITLVVEGALTDGTAFTAADCIRIVGPNGPLGAINVVSDFSGIWIETAPPDDLLDSGGYAEFYRTWPVGTFVTLTAPAMVDGHPFTGWVSTVDDIRRTYPASSLTVSVIAGSHGKMEATYSPLAIFSAPTPGDPSSIGNPGPAGGN